MTHSDRCKSANRFGDGFDCICGHYERPQPAQPEIECVMCSNKFNAPVACRDCTEYAQDSVGVPTPRELEVRAICSELEAACSRSGDTPFIVMRSVCRRYQVDIGGDLVEASNPETLRRLKAWAR